MRNFAWLNIALLAACGSDATDGGTGSNTLLVDADVEATPEVSNGSSAADFTTDFHVRLEKNGADVTTGEVVVASDGGEVALVWDDANGEWRGTQAGYLRGYELHVTSGDDYVHGVRLTGPDLHVFTSPDGTAAIDATAPLEVTWSREAEAGSAEIETREMDSVTIADSGRFELPLGTLRSSPDQTEDDEIRLTRSARIVPDGAVGGSELRVRIENRIELVVAATGL